jgi:hypothetical protein
VTRYQLSPGTAEWLTEWFGFDDPSAFHPNEVSGLITAAISDGIISGGPGGTELAADCIADDNGEPDGWKIMLGPRHLDFWITSGMKRTTGDDGIEIPVTRLQLLTRAVDVANGLLTAWGDGASPGAGPPPSRAGWNSPEDAVYDTVAGTRQQGSRGEVSTLLVNAGVGTEDDAGKVLDRAHKNGRATVPVASGSKTILVTCEPDGEFTFAYLHLRGARS